MSTLLDVVVSRHQSMPLSLRPFALERFFSEFEFNVKHLACCSDSEPLTLKELLQLNSDDDAQQRWESLSLGYTESQGDPTLRKKIAETIYNNNIDADNILVAAPQELVFLAMQALVHQGDTVVCMFPAYQSLYEIAKSRGSNLLFWKGREDPSTKQIYYDIADLKALMTTRPKLVVVNCPHNPTGWLPTHTEWRYLIRLCKDIGAYLFSDEMYRGLELELKDRLEAGASAYHLALSLGGLSKTVGLPGLRIGWIATQEKGILVTMATLKDYTTICSAAPSEALALIALSNYQALLDRQLEIIKSNIRYMETIISTEEYQRVLLWRTPKAGTVAYIPIKLPKSSTDIEAMCRRYAERYGLLLLPGTIYEDPMANMDAGWGRVRIGYGRKSFEAVMLNLRRILGQEGVLSPVID